MRSSAPGIIYSRIRLFLILHFLLALPCSLVSISHPDAGEWRVPEFNLQGTAPNTPAVQVGELKKSIDSTANQLVRNMTASSSLPADRWITLLLRNSSSSDFILTDIVTKLGRKLTHYNFCLEDSGIFHRNTVKKFAISDIPNGRNELFITFLLQELSDSGSQDGKITAKRKGPGGTAPLKGCSLLSDSRCLHKKPLVDTRVVKKCSFRFSWPGEQALSKVIIFDDSNAPQIQDMPTQSLEVARGLFLNQDYLACLWNLSNFFKESASLPKNPAGRTLDDRAGQTSTVDFQALMAEASFLRAECFLHLEMYAEAISAYQEVRKKFPRSDYYHLSLLHLEMAHYLAGHYSQAVIDFEQFDSLAGDRILDPARYIAARSLYQEKKFTQGANLLRRISPASPCFLPARYLQALCHLAVRENDAVVEDLEAIIHLPSPAAIPASGMEELQIILGSESLNAGHLVQSAHLLLGRLWYQEKEYEKSLKEFDAISAKSPQYLSALIGKGLIFLQLRQEEKVRKILDELTPQGLESRFLSDARFSLADNRQKTGRYREAYALYQESIHQCREGLAAIGNLQKDQQYLDNLLRFVLDARKPRSSSPTPSLTAMVPPTSWIYQEVADILSSQGSLSCWHDLERMEKVLQSMRSLLLAPEPGYPEKIKGLSRLMARPEEITEEMKGAHGEDPSSPADPNQPELEKIRQAAFREIVNRENRFGLVREAVITRLKSDIQEALGMISHRLSEIHDRACLEIEHAALQEKLSTPDEKSLAALKKVMTTHESFINRYPQSPYLEKILFQLAEYSYLHASLDYQRMLRAVEGSKNPADFLLETRPNFDQAIKLYERILSQFPHGRYTEKTLYALAYTYQEQGAIILARSVFQRLIQDFPDTSLATEVQVRLGEIFFDENKFAQAAEYYDRAVKSGRLPGQYRNNVLYKLAWSFYKQSQDHKALELFILLADEYARSNNNLLLKEMIYQLAKMGSEYDSLEKVTKLLSPVEEKSYHFQVVKTMADILFNEERFREAIEAYRRVIDRYPLNAEAPVFQARIEQCCLKLADPKAANAAREHLVLNYGENTPWWDNNRDEAIRKQVSLLIDESIRNSTLYLMESTDEKDYQELIRFYRQNLNRFPSAEQVYTIGFLLAECLYKTRQYEQAIAEYSQVVQNKAFRKFTEDAAYKKIICLEKLIEHKAPAGTQQQGPAPEGKAAGIKPEDWSPEEKQFLAACDHLMQSFPKNVHLPEVLYKKGELYLTKGQPQKAIDTFDYLIQHFPESDIRPSALKMLAKARFNQEKFELAARVYSEIVADCDQKLKGREDAEVVSARRNAYKMMALSSYKEAELLTREGKPIEAAQKFEATADEFPREQIADLALFEAARIYQAQGQPQKAHQIFERILEQYPGSEYAPQALLLIAQEQEKNRQLAEAARNYERLYRDYPRFSGSGKALYRAGRLFEEVEDWAKVITIFSLYQSDLRPDPALALEVNFRRGYALMKSGGNTQAEAAFQVVLDTYERYKAQDDTLKPYYPAWARFLIGEMSFEAYDKVRLQDSSDRGMKPKLDMLKKVLENYTKATDFKIAEWAIQAIFKMGLAMDKFAEELGDFSAGQSSEELPKDEASYLLNIQLQMKIIEFLEKAGMFYRQNIQLSEHNNIQDDTWIAKSKENFTRDYWLAGQRYEKIYSLIKDAPVPDSLDEEQVKSYRQALLEKALPYQSQAAEMYAKNTQASAFRIEYNSWIGQSYQRLAIVRPERYRRDEERPLAESRSRFSLPEQLLLRE
ncbi:MAG: tetratricopeptide repeat protein [bacterium]